MNFGFQYGRDFEFQKTQPAFPGEPVSSQGLSHKSPSWQRWDHLRQAEFSRPGGPIRTSEATSLPTTTQSAAESTCSRFGGEVIRFHDVLDSLFQESGAYTYNNRADFISDYTTRRQWLAQPAWEPQRRLRAIRTSSRALASLFGFRTIDYGFFFQDAGASRSA